MGSLENELDKLFDDICRTWGFCLHRDKRQEIVVRDRLDAREFAFEVLRLEGFPLAPPALAEVPRTLRQIDGDGRRFR